MLSATLQKSPFSRNHLIRDASWQAVYDAMREDESVHVFGEGASVKAKYDAPYILEAFPDRVTTLPISEDGNLNFSAGASLVGVKPIVDVISSDFLYRCMDSICNTAAKLDFVTGQQHTIVIRAEFLTGGPTTGQRPEALFAHIPGLRVVIPSTPHDAYGLMRAALATPGVTLFFEDREISDAIVSKKEDLKVDGFVPIGCSLWRMKGQRGNVTIVTYGVMRQRVETLLQKVQTPVGKDYYAEEAKLLVDLIDLRTIYPIDYGYLKFMLGSTGKLLVIEPDIRYGGVGAEIAATIAEEMPDVRVRRVGARKETVPAAASLHHRLWPTDQELIDAITNW